MYFKVIGQLQSFFKWNVLSLLYFYGQPSAVAERLVTC